MEDELQKTEKIILRFDEVMTEKASKVSLNEITLSLKEAIKEKGKILNKF